VGEGLGWGEKQSDKKKQTKKKKTAVNHLKDYINFAIKNVSKSEFSHS